MKTKDIALGVALALGGAIAVKALKPEEEEIPPELSVEVGIPTITQI